MPDTPDLRELFLTALHRTLYDPSAQDRAPVEFLRDVETLDPDPPAPPTSWREALMDTLRGQPRQVLRPPLPPAGFRGATLAPPPAPGLAVEDPWEQLRRVVPDLEGLVHQVRYQPLPDGTLAEYDARTNTIALQPWLDTDPEGPTVLAHEVGHALGYSDRSRRGAPYGTNAVVNAITGAARQRFTPR